MKQVRYARRRPSNTVKKTKSSNHIGATTLKQAEKENPVNPSNRRDNCLACVVAQVLNSMNPSSGEYTADDIERKYGYTGAERKIQLPVATEYIQKATGLRVGKLIDWQNTTAPGHYIIFGGRDNALQHIVYGSISPEGKKVIFDPQIQKEWSYNSFIGKYTGIRTYPLTIR